MRVATFAVARVAALASLLVAALAITGCTAEAAPPVVHTAVARPVVDPERVQVIPDLTYEVADGVPVRLDICRPVVPSTVAITFRPAIVVIHGGSWMEGDKSEAAWRSVCDWLAAAGYVAASVDYRLAPKFVYPTEITDVQHAVEWLRAPAQVKRFGIDRTLIGAFGGSAGGNLAALLGTLGHGSLSAGSRVAAVAELSGPADLTASGAERAILQPRVLAYLGCRSLAACPQAAAASPIDNVDPSDPPFFIAHSTDELIPLSQSLNFVARLHAAHVPVTLQTEPGDLHSVSMLTDTLRARIVDFFHTELVHRATTRS
jgi:acetyl esterase/lipase